MLEYFLAATLTCQSAEAIMLRITTNEDLPPMVKVELVETVREATEVECKWDAND